MGRNAPKKEALVGDGQGQGVQPNIRILDIGAGKDSVARHWWGKEPGVTVTTLDVRDDLGVDVVADITGALPESLVGVFDVVLAHHVLEHVSLVAVPRTILNMVAALKVGGKVHVFVPSLEWAAEQILDAEKASEVLLHHIYGSQEQEAMFHRSGFTIPLLRPLFDMAGVDVRLARIEPYTIRRQEAGEAKARDYEAGAIHLMGVKRESTGR